MSVSIKMSARDKASFNKDIKEYAKFLNVSALKGLEASAQNIRNTAVKLVNENSSDTGLLKNSIKIDRSVKGVRSIGTHTGYGLYIEFGRRPGKPPPYRDLIKWVKRKKIAGSYSIKTRKRSGSKKRQDKENIGLAIAIAKSIGKKGTKAKPFLMPAFQREKKRIMFEVKKAINNAKPKR